MGASDWNYDAKDYSESNFELIPVGDHRVRIKNVEEKESKSGNDMFVLTLEVSGYSGTLWFYLVFMPDNKQLTNQRIGEICESFGIEKPSPQAIMNAVGKVGAARIKHESYNNEQQARISYFRTRKQAEKLPPWKETDMVSTDASTPFDTGDLPLPNEFQPMDDAELPF